jgi:hypothetical protein
MQKDYEKLGLFYLGRIHDLTKKKTADDKLTYESKDLTTHAVCIGMTGSGKTGLCIDLLEEAAIDGIPSIVIDPKGDMGNLLLTFPGLSPSEFRPWINGSEAQQKGQSLDDFAVDQANLWKTGLQKWDIEPERIQRLRECADFIIYTPGSNAGIPVSIVKSFAAPPQTTIDDSDSFAERIATTATSLLGLLGIDADPIKSREHILISNILYSFWQKGQDLDLSMLIQAIQSPPMTKIGVFDVESFFPSKDRFVLAMTLNNLLAAPAFQSWLEGEAFDAQNFFYSPSGKPRVSVFYIAHLSDAERMFFVSLLLNQVLSWMRGQAGTTSLRAILYFDEIFGYMPPVANPPSKKPLMTLLKQARAFGLGVVLATQNPVDLDYKGLSNTGTWFIGRLQTERDRDRVLDGLASADATNFDRKKFETIITSLGKRVFLMHDVHEDKPEVFESRWAMSYLAGPLTKAQIKGLADAQKTGSEPAKKTRPIAKSIEGEASPQQPNLSTDIPQYFIPAAQDKTAARILYRPHVWASAKLQYIDNRTKTDKTDTIRLIAPIINAAIPVEWENAVAVKVDENRLSKTPEKNAFFDAVPPVATQVKNYNAWKNDAKNFFDTTFKINLYKSPTLNATSEPGEEESDFRIRLKQIAREKRDEWTESLKSKYAAKIASLQSKIRTAQDRVEREKAQATQQKFNTAISIGTTLLGAFLGRKAISRSTISKAGTAVRSATRAGKESGDVAMATENLEELQAQLNDLQQEFQSEVDAFEQKVDSSSEELETITIRPSHTAMQLFSFVWVPFIENEDKTIERAY